MTLTVLNVLSHEVHGEPLLEPRDLLSVITSKLLISHIRLSPCLCNRLSEWNLIILSLVL